MPTILFVCMANQFRSPLAEVLFKKLLREKNKSEGWTVNSAGTWVKEAVGAHRTAIFLAEQMGLDLKKHVTREVDRGKIEVADLVIVMTEGQKEALQFEFPEFSSKIVMLTELSGNRVSDIPDPALSNFENCEEIITDLSSEINKAFEKIVRWVGG